MKSDFECRGDPEVKKSSPSLMNLLFMAGKDIYFNSLEKRQGFKYPKCGKECHSQKVC